MGAFAPAPPTLFFAPASFCTHANTPSVYPYTDTPRSPGRAQTQTCSRSIRAHVFGEVAPARHCRVLLIST